MPRGGFRIGAGRPKKGEVRIKAVYVKRISEPRPKKCAHCGETYTSKRYKYCSYECMYLVNKKSVAERRRNNPEKVKEYREKEKQSLYERLKIRRRTDAGFALHCRMACIIYYGLRSAKKGRKWQELVGYSIDDLRRHIEKQFKGGMSWNRFLAGEIHIDHKIPRAAFNFSHPDDPDFKKCWDLKNLQPMWASENMSKGARLEKPFQPSLTL